MNEKDIEKEAGVGMVQATTSTGSSSTPTVRSPPTISDCKFGWRDISYSVDTTKGKKQILDHVTGCVEKGSPLLPIPPFVVVRY